MQKILEKLANIQKEANVGKNIKNEFGNFNYRSVEQIYEKAKPICEKFKCTLILSDEIIQVGERYYVKAISTLYDNESEEKVESVAYAREDLERPKMCSSQVTGSASSYARKYALGGLLLLDDNEDVDSQDNTKKEESKLNNQKNNKPSTPKLTGEQRETIQNEIIAIQNELNVKLENFVKLLNLKFKKNSFNELTDLELNNLLSYMKQKREERKIESDKNNN